MLLSELIKNLNIISISGFADFDVKQITHDSRQVKKDSVFICLKGASFDGHDFIRDAVACGARAVIYGDSEKIKPFENEITAVKTENTHEALAFAAMQFYHHPEKLIKTIGITGTNGKTSTSILINEILKCANMKTALVGTLYIEIDNKRCDTKNTTPSSLSIIKIMADMVKQGASYLIMEVSSHALSQGRVCGIPFDAAVFTNLTQDHLDYHANMENYFQAKLKLFKQLDALKNSHKNPIAVLNADDYKTAEIMEHTKAKVFTYGVKNKADLFAEDISINESGIAYLLKNATFEKRVNLNLLGHFNVYNSLAAALTCLKLGIDKEIVLNALESVKPIRGRFEYITAKGNFKIIIDYAHTPDGLLNLLQSVKKISKGKIITVFGCGGDRDKTKRPVMGRIAAEFSDFIIITSDNPRTEEPLSIIKQIEDGVKEKTSNYIIEPDRETAIKKAVETAAEGDFVVIAGKGHETYQIFKDKTIHFDDKETAEKILNDK